MEDLTGKQLGPYQIVAPLGEGGMAAVFKAYQPSMDRYVALKVLPRHFANDPEFIGRFSQEAKVIANLQHPHILPVHDFGEADGYTYLAMRFIEGGTLGDWLKNNGPLSLEKIRSIITQVGGALDYAHAHGVIHRDIKPSNILVDEWGNCLLTDFGLAKMAESSSHLTQTGGILGTPAYMSPEQGLGKKIDSRSDIYSLGVVLYQMAIGRLPYQAETPMAVVIKHIHDPLPPPSKFKPDLPEALERVILKALAKNPDDRFATAVEMVNALQNATEPPTITKAEAALEPVIAPEPEIDLMELETAVPVPSPTIRPKPLPPLEPTVVEPPPESPLPGRKRNYWLIGGGLVGLVAIILVGLLIANSLGQDEDTPDVPEPAEVTAVTENNNPPDRQNAQTIDELFVVVDEAYAAGDIDRALDAINQAIELEPNQPDLYCQRGYTQRDMENYPAAAESFEQCRVMAKEQQIHDLQAEALGQSTLTQVEIVLRQTDDIQKALSIVDDALQKPDAPPWLICERGELNTWYDNEAAVADFKACKNQNPDDDYWPWRAESVINMILGYMALDEEDYRAALEHFSNWTDIAPDEYWAHCALGDTYAGLNEYAPALDQYVLCQQLAQAHDDESAAREAQSGQSYVQARMAIDDGNVEQALENYNRTVDLTPDNASLYCERGELHQELGHIDEARNDFVTCLEMSGDDPDGRAWAEDLLRSLEPSN
ncbi:MAG: tetratricopeptide repeat protein [Ardenticatenaceae bacterium]|nr:tetratricopeptide repeat protein [Ardenticatenaceae bacterium]MCB9444967.1 tetratricopeptide repeat protein [Ardenticatenaceae bacterium]